MSPASSRRPALMAFVERLRQHLPAHIVDVRLFGSEARGEATGESDLDVLVVVQPEDERAALEDRIVDLAFDVNLEFDVFISPTVLTAGIINHPIWRETVFLDNVLREGIPL